MNKKLLKYSMVSAIIFFVTILVLLYTIGYVEEQRISQMLDMSYPNAYLKYIEENEDDIFSDDIICKDENYFSMELFSEEYEDFNITIVKEEFNTMGLDPFSTFLNHSNPCYFESECGMLYSEGERCLDFMSEIQLNYIEKENLALFARDRGIDYRDHIEFTDEERCQLYTHKEFSDMMTRRDIERCERSEVNNNIVEKMKNNYVSEETSSIISEHRNFDNFVNVCENTGICGCDYKNMSRFDFYSNLDSLTSFPCGLEGPEEDEIDDALRLNEIFDEIVDIQDAVHRDYFEEFHDFERICRSIDQGNQCDNLEGEDKMFCRIITGTDCRNYDYEETDISMGARTFCFFSERNEDFSDFMINTVCE